MKLVAALSSFLLFTLSLAIAIPDGAVPLEVVSSHPLEARHKCHKSGELPPGYLAPTLMVPISKDLPDVAFGPTQFPLISPNDFCTIFNLEIPSSGYNQNCTLEFLFPDHKATYAPYVYNGPGHFTFTGYAFNSGATDKTTYNKQPPAGPSPPSPPSVLSPGHGYVINAGPCFIPEGQESMEVSGALCSTDTYFSYLQTADDGCPIGFYVIIS